MSNLGKVSRSVFMIGSLWLIINGISDMTTTSKSNRYESWFDETSLAALGIRSNGSLKVGLGVGSLGVAVIGVEKSSDNYSKRTMSFENSVTQSSDGTKESNFKVCSEIYTLNGGKKKSEFD